MNRNVFHQICGRAGRPGLDPVGHAIIFASGIDEYQQIIRQYFLHYEPSSGKVVPYFEDVHSSFLSSSLLLEELVLLRVYKLGMATTYDLHSFFEDTFYNFKSAADLNKSGGSKPSLDTSSGGNRSLPFHLRLYYPSPLLFLKFFSHIPIISTLSSCGIISEVFLYKPSSHLILDMVYSLPKRAPKSCESIVCVDISLNNGITIKPDNMWSTFLSLSGIDDLVEMEEEIFGTLGEVLDPALNISKYEKTGFFFHILAFIYAMVYPTQDHFIYYNPNTNAEPEPTFKEMYRFILDVLLQNKPCISNLHKMGMIEYISTPGQDDEGEAQWGMKPELEESGESINEENFSTMLEFSDGSNESPMLNNSILSEGNFHEGQGFFMEPLIKCTKLGEITIKSYISPYFAHLLHNFIENLIKKYQKTSKAPSLGDFYPIVKLILYLKGETHVAFTPLVIEGILRNEPIEAVWMNIQRQIKNGGGRRTIYISDVLHLLESITRVFKFFKEYFSLLHPEMDEVNFPLIYKKMKSILFG